MSSLLINVLIPVLVLLALGRFRPRDVWLWSWPAWAVDVDYLGWIVHVQYGWPNFHRALFHNAWWLLILLGGSFLAWKRWHTRTQAPWSAFTQARPAWLLMPFFYASHLILDLFAGGIVPFWPLSNQAIYWDFTIDFDTTKPLPAPQVTSDPGTYVGVPDVSSTYTWLTAQEFAIFLLYVLSWIVYVVSHLPRHAPEQESVASRSTQLPKVR